MNPPDDSPTTFDFPALVRQKRQIYQALLIALPLVIVGKWAMTALATGLTADQLVLTVPVAVASAAMALALRWPTVPLRYLEAGMYVLVVGLYLTALTMGAVAWVRAEVGGPLHLLRVSYWFPLILVMTYLILSRRLAAQAAWVLLACLPLTVAVALATRPELPADLTLTVVEAVLLQIVTLVAIRGLVQVARTVGRRAQHMEELADRDPLTDLANRRLLLRQLEEQVERAERYDRTLALLMLDLDRFKELNDEHGHAVGDAALAQVADALRRTFRAADVVGRLGGDEFVAILPEQSAEQAETAAERALEAIRSDARLTASAGAVVRAKGESAAALLNRADQAMYRGKRDGRNRVWVDGRSSDMGGLAEPPS